MVRWCQLLSRSPLGLRWICLRVWEWRGATKFHGWRSHALFLVAKRGQIFHDWTKPKLSYCQLQVILISSLKYSQIHVFFWRFPEMGLPLVIIYFDRILGFSYGFISMVFLWFSYGLGYPLLVSPVYSRCRFAVKRLLSPSPDLLRVDGEMNRWCSLWYYLFIYIYIYIYILAWYTMIYRFILILDFRSFFAGNNGFEAWFEKYCRDYMASPQMLWIHAVDFPCTNSGIWRIVME